MSLAFQFSESETRILLESLAAQERGLVEVCETTHNKNTLADAGNDLVELRLLLNRVRDAAVAEFGQRVLEISRTPL